MRMMNKGNTVIALVLILAITVSMFTMPVATAHTPPDNIASYAYIVAAPNPVGVGQPTYISMWVDTVLPAADLLNDIRRHDYTLTIMRPDNKTVTQHWDVIQDTTGIQFYSFTPDITGEYTLKLDYGGQVYTWGQGTPAIGQNWVYQNDTFLPSTRTVKLNVQEEPLPAPITSYPLPTEYWTRPIEAQNTDWWGISSNWLSEPYIMERTQPYGTAPNSPHIMWTKPIDTGGVVGGLYDDIQGEGFYMGRSYNSRFTYPIVMNGVLYYQLPLGNSGQGGGTIAVDLRTGEELWYNDKIGAYAAAGPGRSDHDAPPRILPPIQFGSYISVPSPNQHGVIPQGLLWSANFGTAYDAQTGRLMYNTTGVPSGGQTIDSHGAVLRYVINSAGKSIAQWNSSRMWTYGWVSEGGTTPAFGVTLNATNELVSRQSCYDWNITIPSLRSGTWSIPSTGRTGGYLVSADNIMILTQGSLGAFLPTGVPTWTGLNVTAVSLKPESRGTILWNTYIPPAPDNRSQWIQGWDTEIGVFVIYERETFKRFGYSLTDGSLLWTTDSESINDFGWFDYFFAGFNAYGKMYYSGYNGVLHCWDLKTGELEWTYGNGGVPGNSTFDVQQSWGLRPLMIQAIADGKIYASGDEHSPNTPLYKDNLVRCINATDGTEIWTMKGWIPGMGGGGTPENAFVADGFLGYLNAYDMQVYVVGKGPSAMTVEAPAFATKLGDSIVIRGTVTDIAAGTKQDEQATRFPNGVPAVSDESMGRWMEYVYMQKPRPTDVTGVPVTISVVDANGNYRNLDTVASDSDGFYSLKWKPDIEGKYTIYASFAGSESYWPSHAVSAFAVDPAAPTQAPNATTAPSAVEQYFIPAVAGIAVLIIACFAVTILVLRKRP